MTRRNFLWTLGAAAGVAALGKRMLAEGSRGRKPNIVLINADDLGYGDLGCYGATKVKTPNIDRLARQGRRFTDAHAASAVCSPSRYALLTGRYPFRKNVWGPIMLKSPLVVDTDRLTIGRLMKEAGYATACIGKWHLGFGEKRPVDWNKPLKPGPLELGFDYYFGVPVVSSHPPFVYVENHHVVGLDEDDPFVYGQKAETREYPEKFGLDAIGGAKAAHAAYKDDEVAATLADKAVEWMAKHKDGPFFLYLPTPHIHHPFTADKRFVGTSGCGRYGDFIHELDWIVGEMLAALDKWRLADETLVIFTSDNGGMLNRGGQDAWKAGHRMNADLLGFKFDAWEGGHRVPFIVRWPGKAPARTTSDQLISNVDMLATLAALVGRTLKDDEGPDSFNILPAITGDPAEPVRDHLVICPRSEKHISLRMGKWMYIAAKGNGGWTGGKVGSHIFGGPAAMGLTGQKTSDVADGKFRPDAPPAQLYDLSADSAEAENLHDARPEVAAKARKLLEACRKANRTAPRE